MSPTDKTWYTPALYISVIVAGAAVGHGIAVTDVGSLLSSPDTPDAWSSENWTSPYQDLLLDDLSMFRRQNLTINGSIKKTAYVGGMNGIRDGWDSDGTYISQSFSLNQSEQYTVKAGNIIAGPYMSESGVFRGLNTEEIGARGIVALRPGQFLRRTVTPPSPHFSVIIRAANGWKYSVSPANCRAAAGMAVVVNGEVVRETAVTDDRGYTTWVIPPEDIRARDNDSSIYVQSVFPDACDASPILAVDAFYATTAPVT